MLDFIGIIFDDVATIKTFFDLPNPIPDSNKTAPKYHITSKRNTTMIINNLLSWSW